MAEWPWPNGHGQKLRGGAVFASAGSPSRTLNKQNAIKGLPQTLQGFGQQRLGNVQDPGGTGQAAIVADCHWPHVADSQNPAN